MKSKILEGAIKVAASDGKIKDSELKEIYELADKENISRDEVDKYLKTFKINCPRCSKEMAYRSFMCHKCGYVNNNRYRSLHKYVEIFTPIIHLLGLVAIIIAIYELTAVHKISADTNALARKTDTLVSSTNRVLSQMRTTHMEDFPNNMKGLMKMIDSAKKSIEIVVDVPAYGYFSSPDTCAMFENKIINRMTSNEQVKFMMIVYNPIKRKETLIKQLQFEDKNLDSEIDFKNFLTEKPEFKNRLDSFMKHYHIPNINTFQKLWENIEKGNQDFLRRLKDQSKYDVYHEVNCDLTSYFWLIDGEQIAYSFVSLGKLAQECTFKSTDNDLLVTMKKTFENLKKED